MLPEPSKEHNPSKLGYIEWHIKSAELYEKGVEQKQCEKCGLWFWPDEF
jgi:hypothetical protein